MTVQLLYTEGCPHVAAYLPDLLQLVAAAGVDALVQTQVVVDHEHAQQERFLGSPTVRVDGVDVDPTAAARNDFGITCRLYATKEGLRVRPADAWVLSALHHHLDRRR
jgi:hypothetical protein